MKHAVKATKQFGAGIGHWKSWCTDMPHVRPAHASCMCLLGFTCLHSNSPAAARPLCTFNRLLTRNTGSCSNMCQPQQDRQVLTYDSTFVWPDVTAFVLDPGLLQLLIRHKLDGIKGQISEHERPIASKQSAHSLTFQYGLYSITCSSCKLPCKRKECVFVLSHCLAGASAKALFTGFGLGNICQAPS